MPQSAAPPEPLHVDIFNWTAADWSIVASLFTIVGVLIALFGRLLALVANQYANRLASHAHMHGLLRDYLRARFDYQLALTSASAEASRPASLTLRARSAFGAARDGAEAPSFVLGFGLSPT